MKEKLAGVVIHNVSARSTGVIQRDEQQQYACPRGLETAWK